VTDTCVISGSDDHFSPLFRLTSPTHARYAAEQGYDYQAFRFEARDYPPSWSKIPVLRAALHSYQRVLWIDADAAFIRSEAIPDDRPVTLAHQRLADAEGNAWNWPCCGLMALAGDIGVEFLDVLWKGLERYRDHPWWEQAMAYEALGYDNAILGPGQGDPYLGPTEWTDDVGFFPDHWHSTPQDPRDRAIVFHATAYPLPRRIALMQDILGA
jgi:hypothetical protein